MESSEPTTIIGAIGAISAAASAVTGIVSATQKPDEPKMPKAGLSPAALSEQRRQRAAATGRSNTILTSQKLGQVGGQ